MQVKDLLIRLNDFSDDAEVMDGAGNPMQFIGYSGQHRNGVIISAYDPLQRSVALILSWGRYLKKHHDREMLTKNHWPILLQEVLGIRTEFGLFENDLAREVIRRVPGVFPEDLQGLNGLLEGTTLEVSDKLLKFARDLEARGQ